MINFGDPVEFGYNNPAQWTRHQHHLSQFLGQFNFPPLHVNDLNTMARYYYLDGRTDWVRFLNAEMNAVYFTNDASASAESLVNFTGNTLSWDIDFNNFMFEEFVNQMTITLTREQAEHARAMIDLTAVTGLLDALRDPALQADLPQMVPAYYQLAPAQLAHIRANANRVTRKYGQIEIDQQNRLSYDHYQLLRQLIPNLPDPDLRQIEELVAEDIRRYKPTKYWDNQSYVTYETTENLDALALLQTYQHIMPPIGSNYDRLTTSTRSGSFYDRTHMPVRFTSKTEDEYSRYVSAVKPYFSQTRP